MKKINYTWANIWSGVLIYAIGDTLATLITGDISLGRMIGMAFLGGTIYAIEVPNWFLLIDKWTKKCKRGWQTGTLRMLLAMAYFNPLWIARHILFIDLFTGQFENITWGLLNVGWMSFLMNIPLSILGNYLIQNKLRYEHRYVANCIFSSIMAISYAMGAVWFK